MSKTSTERVCKLRNEAKRKGWKRREYYATPAEHKELKVWLAALRKGERVLILPPAVKIKR